MARIKHISLRRHLDFIVIGAQKSGTTTLYKHLGAHPRIYLPPEKEAPFFSLDERFDRGWTSYVRRYFGHADSSLIWGKISPQYLVDPRVPQRLRDTLPGVALVAILREPVSRARSHYLMNVRRGLEHRSFDDALRANLRPSALAHAYTLPARIENEAACYVAWGEYGRLLRRYLRWFDRDAVTIVFTDALRRDPQGTMDTILMRLGLGSGFEPPHLGRAFHLGGGRERVPGLERLARENRVVRSAWRTLPERPRQRVAYWVKQLNSRPGSHAENTVLSEETLERAQAHFDRDRDVLEELIGVPAPWPRTSGKADAGRRPLVDA